MVALRSSSTQSPLFKPSNNRIATRTATENINDRSSFKSFYSSVNSSSSFPLVSSWQFPDNVYLVPLTTTEMMLNDEQINRINFDDQDPDDHEGGDDDDPYAASTKSRAKDCLTKSKQVIPFGTSPKFKKPQDVMQTLVAGWLGHRHELLCPHRKGCPKARVHWFKDGVKVVSSKRKSGPSVIRISRKGEKLTIEDNRHDDDGLYTCMIFNKFGRISHTIRVTSAQRTVAASPEIQDDQPGNHTVVVGNNLTMYCQLKIIDPTSPHHMEWYKHYTVNGSWHDDNGKLYVEKLKQTGDNPEDDQVLHLVNVSMNHGGWYSCRVSNQYDRVVEHGYVEVIQPPEEEVPLSPFYIYLAVGIGGGLGLSLLIVVILMCVKYRREKKSKLLAVENAQCVARWTKKIIIERNFVAGINEQEQILSPHVRVEKVLAPRENWTQEENSEELFEIQIDELWEFPRERLKLGTELGQGAFGKVIQGQVHGAVLQTELSTVSGCPLVICHGDVSPITVAVKMTKEHCSEQEILDLVKEIEIMKAVGGHVNIVNLLAACTQPTGKPLLAILEYAEHGNLRDYLRRRRGFGRFSREELDIDPRPVGLKEMLSFAWQVARGMEFLASRRCVHRDLAARNVLIAKGGVAKVADFGLARDVEQTDYYRKVTEGKLPVMWMSPESLFDGVSTIKSDVWSYGVLLWEIVTCGEKPYTGVAIEALLDLIKNGYRMSIPLQCPQELYQIMRNCWQLKPSARPTWTQLVDGLLCLYHETMPGVYLDLALPSIPTPPSTAENSDCSDAGAGVSVYNTITSAVSGIAPLPRIHQVFQKVNSNTVSSNYGSSVMMDDQDQEEEDDFTQGPSRDSLESGYSSGAGVKSVPELDVSYYNDLKMPNDAVTTETDFD